MARIVHTSSEDAIAEANNALGSKEKGQVQQLDRRQCIDCGSESTYVNKKTGQNSGITIHLMDGYVTNVTIRGGCPFLTVQVFRNG